MMEASTGGAPASGAAASTGDAQIDAALQAVEDHLNQAKGRVTSDLAALRDEVAKSQAAGQPVDHSVVISRLTAILEVVDAIDPQQAVAGGTATTTGTTADGAAAGGGEAPAPPAEQPVTGQTPAGADPSAPAATASQGEAAAQPQPADALAVYTFSGDPSLIDAAVWPRANVVTEDGHPLYHYSGDSAPGEQHGNGLDDGQWQLYTGNVRPVASA